MFDEKELLKMNERAMGTNNYVSGYEDGIKDATDKILAWCQKETNDANNFEGFAVLSTGAKIATIAKLVALIKEIRDTV